VSTLFFAVYYRKGTSGIVIKAFNNELFFCVNEKVYALELIPSHVSSSKNFDFANVPKPFTSNESSMETSFIAIVINKFIDKK
jgi:hypothetical protein